MAKETMQHGPAKHPNKRRFVGLSLEKFAAAKNSTYDKQRRKEREDNLRAGKINKYRKLKAKLQRSGELHGTNYTEASNNDDLDTEAGGHPHASPSEPSDRGQEAERRERAAAGGRVGDREGSSEEDAGERSGGLAEPSRRQAGEQNQKKRRSEADDKPGKSSGKKQRTKPTQVERLAAKAKAEKDAVERAREEARQAREKRQAQIVAVEKQRKQQSKLFRQKTSRGQPVMKHRINKILEILEKS